MSNQYEQTVWINKVTKLPTIYEVINKSSLGDDGYSRDKVLFIENSINDSIFDIPTLDFEIINSEFDSVMNNWVRGE